MNTQTDIILISQGYLNEVVEENNQIIAHICKIHECEQAGGESEVIWLDCVIANEHLQKLLRSYQSTLSKGHAIIVKFSANYLGIVGFQSGLTEEDPNNIITMKTQLTNILAIYKDGVQHYPQ